MAYDEYSNKLFITGEHYFNGSHNYFLARLSADNGIFEKAILILWSSIINHWLSTIVPDGKGGIYVGDWVDYYAGRWHTGAYVLKFDVDLNYKWSKGIMENVGVYTWIPWDYFIKPLDVNSQGNLYAGILLTMVINNIWHRPFSLMKVSSNGTLIKAIAYGSAKPEIKIDSSYLIYYRNQ